MQLLLFVDSVSSEEVISDDVSSVSELVVVLVSGEPGEDCSNGSSCTGTLCSPSMVVRGWLMAVRCASICLRLVVVAHVEFSSGGLGRNLWHGAGIGLALMVLKWLFFSFRSGCVAADGPGMVEFTLEFGCSTVAGGLGMFEFMWESGCFVVADGLGMVVCMGICFANCGSSFCHLIQ